MMDFPRVFGWLSRLKKGWVFLGFLDGFWVRVLKGLPRVFRGFFSRV